VISTDLDETEKKCIKGEFFEAKIIVEKINKTKIKSSSINLDLNFILVFLSEITKKDKIPKILE